MFELGGDRDFAQEPLGTENDGQLGLEHLDRDVAAELQVLCEIDGRHPAATQLAPHRIAIAQCRGEVLQLVCHLQTRCDVDRLGARSPEILPECGTWVTAPHRHHRLPPRATWP